MTQKLELPQSILDPGEKRTGAIGLLLDFA